MSDDLRTVLMHAKAGERTAFARLLTMIERGQLDEKAYSELLDVKQPALRLGITGPPGAGKSTLVGQLIGIAREKGLRVGVMAVDPSSPFTHGAILADRIRYTEHTLDDGVFIRSLGTRGSLGGLSASAYLMARAFDICQFDLLLVETVGVGQTELEIVNLADRVAIILVPESGDAVQAMKAGLLEISDLFVVNKADRPGADQLQNELQATMELSGASVRIHQTIANRGDGVKELFELISEELSEDEIHQRGSQKRIQAEARSLLRQQFEKDISKSLAAIQSDTDLLSFFTKHNSRK